VTAAGPRVLLGAAAPVTRAAAPARMRVTRAAIRSTVSKASGVASASGIRIRVLSSRGSAQRHHRETSRRCPRDQGVCRGSRDRRPPPGTVLTMYSRMTQVRSSMRLAPLSGSQLHGSRQRLGMARPARAGHGLEPPASSFRACQSSSMTVEQIPRLARQTPSPAAPAARSCRCAVRGSDATNIDHLQAWPAARASSAPVFMNLELEVVARREARLQRDERLQPPSMSPGRAWPPPADSGHRRLLQQRRLHLEGPHQVPDRVDHESSSRRRTRSSRRRRSSRDRRTGTSRCGTAPRSPAG